MSRKEILTTFEAADVCHVSYNTIKNWIKRGLLTAYRTAGGHLRIRIEDLEDFSRGYGIPLRDKDDSIRRRVLILDSDSSFRNTFDESFAHYGDKIEVHTTADPFEAGAYIESVRPDLVVINSHTPGIDGVKVCNYIRKSSSMKHIKVVILNDSLEDGVDGEAEKFGADVSLTTPVDKVNLLESIEPIIMPKRGVRGRKRKKTAL